MLIHCTRSPAAADTGQPQLGLDLPRPDQNVLGQDTANTGQLPMDLDPFLSDFLKGPANTGQPQSDLEPGEMWEDLVASSQKAEGALSSGGPALVKVYTPGWR